MTLSAWLDNQQKVPVTAKIFLLQNLSVMIKAGLPLADAISTIGGQTKNRKLKSILMQVQEKVRTGKTMAEALTPFTDDFDEIFINMVAAGEASGSLETALKNLYLQAKRDHNLKSKIKNAMTYPVIITCAMFGIGTFMLVFVLPNITSMFAASGNALPLPTQILLGFSDFLTKNGLIILPALVLSLLIFFRLIKSGAGRLVWHKILLKTPVVGEIVRKVNVSHLAANLSNLINTDIAIPEALKITSKTVNNAWYQQALLEAAEKVKKGRRLADIFKDYPQIMPSILVQMISVGEETGSLDEVLKNLADFYQEEVEQTMDNLPVIIEPILMLMMGVAVGCLAIAVILPIYAMTQNY